jgi:molybdenum cofactor synthesis domain-containing protein
MAQCATPVAATREDGQGLLRSQASPAVNGRRFLLSDLGMTDSHQTSDTVTAALIIIGEEILSGRTRDENISHIAGYLTEIGIALQEVRVVRDVEAEIVAAVNALRARYSYVFTTGGIGPTHDDVTTDAIASAFGVGVEIDERAVEAMQKGYSRLELTPARLRMARIPHGAELVDNPVSRAPGFMLGNVIVMAGIPRIMQVMLDAVAPRLKKGRPMLSRSIRIEAPEGDVAPGLAAIQAAHQDVQIGSYPFFEKAKLGTYVVLRSVDTTALDRVHGALRELIAKERFKASEGEAEGKS